MSDAARDRLPPLAIGTVLGRAFGVMTGNPLTVFALAFLFGALPSGVAAVFTRFETGGDRDAQAGLAALYIGYAVIFVLCSALSQAALVRATSAYLDGRTAGIGECMRVGIVKALPVIGLITLSVLGIFLGLFVFLVPGIMLLVRWAVVTPALVEEDCGVTRAFGRSADLTKGARWHIFALLIVTLVIVWLISAVAAIPTLMLGIDRMGVEYASPVAIGLSLVSSTITTALWSTVLTSLYFTLRERREGPQTQQLADIFA
jgi:hypothetical protein